VADTVRTVVPVGVSSSRTAEYMLGSNTGLSSFWSRTVMVTMAVPERGVELRELVATAVKLKEERSSLSYKQTRKPFNTVA